MALMEETFKRSTSGYAAPTDQGHSQQESAGEGAQSAGLSSLDATLSEVRDQVTSQKSQREGQAKRTTKPKRVQRRGVPVREEFFTKIDWTPSFISGPADPLHNPQMVLYHMCKKNFSAKKKWYR